MMCGALELAKNLSNTRRAGVARLYHTKKYLTMPSRRFRIALILFLGFWVLDLSSSSSTTSPRSSPFGPSTRVSGFGSRATRKSIFSTQSKILNSNTEANLWTYKDEDNVLWFRDNDGGTPFCISLDEQGGWSILEESDATIQAASSESKKWVPCEGVYGLYCIPSGLVVVLIPKTDPVFQAPALSWLKGWWNIQKVTQLELVHLSNSKAFSPNQIKEEMRQLRLLRRALKQHTFYCCRDSYLVPDITKTLQKSICESDEFEEDWWNSEYQPDPRFFWNQEAVALLTCRKEMDSQSVERLLQHVIPVTSAFVGVQSNLTAGDDKNSSTSYTQLLISRRSRFRAGTRFTRRGADATGSVANYAETEQVVLTEREGSPHRIYSHVQTRGSIPLRWSSPADVKTYRPKVRIGTDPTAQAQALRKHLVEQQLYYGDGVVFCNLVDKKSDQGRLGRAFDSVLQAVLDVYNSTTPCSTGIRHVWYDFHAEVKNGRWERLNMLLKDLQPYLEDHGYFEASLEEADNVRVESKQISAVRTNCMDCLDRTNVVQSLLGRFILFQQICRDSDKNAKKKFTKTQQLTLPWNQGEVAHRSLWADNADAISRLYAGTPALKRDFTRTGKRTNKGALDDGMNSLQRYYLNNFLDADRQEGMDLMVGHANFSNVGISSAVKTNEPSPFGVQKTARHAFLGNLLGSNNQDLEEQLGEVGVGDNVDQSLDLRWVPGDLQSHLRSQADEVEVASSNTTSNQTFGFSSTKALKAIDERSTSDRPWWYQEEDDANDEENSLLDPHQQQPISRPLHMLFFLIIGIKAPMTLASSVVGLLGMISVKEIFQQTSYFIEGISKKNDDN